VNGEVVREGEMPEKTIYTINDKGKKYFLRLMQKYSEEPEKLSIDFASFISNLHHVDPAAGLKMVENLQRNLAFRLETVEGQLERMKEASFYATSVVKLYQQTYQVFYNWSVDFKNQYTDQVKK
jgi:DNA-binding PadR family transcriptional regulator